MRFNYNNLSETTDQINLSVSNIRGAVSTGINGYFDKFGGTNSKLKINNTLHIPDADGTKLTDKNIEVFYTFYLLLAQTLQDAKTLQDNGEVSRELKEKDRKHIAQLEGFLEPFVVSLSKITSIMSEPETIAPFMKALHTAGLLEVLPTLEMQPKIGQRKGQHYELEPEQLTTIWATVNKQSPKLNQAYESLHQKVEVLQQQVLDAEKQKQEERELAKKVRAFYNLDRSNESRSGSMTSERSESELTEKNLADHRASFSKKNKSPTSSEGHTDGETRSTNSSQDDNHSSVSKDLKQQNSTMKDTNSATSTPGVNAPTSVPLAVGRYARTPSHEQRDQEARRVQEKQYKLCKTLWSDTEVRKKMASDSSLMEKKTLLSDHIKKNTLFDGNTIPLKNGQTLRIKITTNNKPQPLTTNISLTIEEPEPFLDRTLRAFINFFRGLVFYPPLKQAQPAYTSFSVHEDETLPPKVITRHYESESHPGISFMQSIGRTLQAPFTTLTTPSPKTHFTYEPVPIEEPEPEQEKVTSGKDPRIPFSSYLVKDEKKPTPEKKLAELGLCQTYNLRRPAVILDSFNKAEPDSEIATSLQKDLELFKAFIALVIEQQAVAYNSINTKLSQWELTNPGSFNTHLAYLQDPTNIRLVTEALNADKTGFNKNDTTQTQALQKTLKSLRNASQQAQEGMKSVSNFFSKIASTASSPHNPSKKK